MADLDPLKKNASLTPTAAPPHPASQGSTSEVPSLLPAATTTSVWGTSARAIFTCQGSPRAA
eukprot:1178525-Prorocentrum_minimum.AAC.2